MEYKQRFEKKTLIFFDFFNRIHRIKIESLSTRLINDLIKAFKEFNVVLTLNI